MMTWWRPGAPPEGRTTCHTPTRSHHEAIASVIASPGTPATSTSTAAKSARSLPTIDATAPPWPIRSWPCSREATGTPATRRFVASSAKKTPGSNSHSSNRRHTSRASSWHARAYAAILGSTKPPLLLARSETNTRASAAKLGLSVASPRAALAGAAFVVFRALPRYALPGQRQRHLILRAERAVVAPDVAFEEGLHGQTFTLGPRFQLCAAGGGHAEGHHDGARVASRVRYSHECILPFKTPEARHSDIRACCEHYKGSVRCCVKRSRATTARISTPAEHPRGHRLR